MKRTARARFWSAALPLVALLGWVGGDSTQKDVEVLELREAVNEQTQHNFAEKTIGAGQQDFVVTKHLRQICPVQLLAHERIAARK